MEGTCVNEIIKLNGAEIISIDARKCWYDYSINFKLRRNYHNCISENFFLTYYMLTFSAVKCQEDHNCE